ncbi:MAG: sensor histidine kinase [Anaerorhabdus sp.]
MKNKRLFRKGLEILIVGVYFALAILFVYNTVNLDRFYQRAQEKYNYEAEKKINDVFDTNPSSEELDELIHQYPMELVVVDSQGAIYQTLPVEDINTWFGKISREAIGVEARFDAVMNNQDVEVWFCLYRISEQAFLIKFLIQQAVLLFILFLVGLFSVLYGQRALQKPLREMKESIDMANRYEFDKVRADSDNELHRGFGEFTQKVDKTITAMSYQNTQLETELQQERERMKSAMVVARSLVHDLKAPVHQNLMENEAEMLKSTEPVVKELMRKNVETADRSLKRINETLNLLGSQFRQEVKSEEIVDVDELYMETIHIYDYQIREKGLNLDLSLDSDVKLLCNKATIQMLIHNLISNMIQYAKRDSDLIVDIQQTQEELILVHSNQAETLDLERMKKTENLFNVVGLEKSKTNRYSSGNGLFLIRDLTKMLGGVYLLETYGNEVLVKIVIPHGGER